MKKVVSDLFEERAEGFRLFGGKSLEHDRLRFDDLAEKGAFGFSAFFRQIHVGLSLVDLVRFTADEPFLLHLFEGYADGGGFQMGLFYNVDLGYAILMREMAQNLAIAVFETKLLGIFCHSVLKELGNLIDQHIGIWFTAFFVVCLHGLSLSFYN